MLTYDDIIKAMDELAPDVPVVHVQGIIIPSTDNIEDILAHVPLPKQTLWIKTSDLLPGGVVIVMGKQTQPRIPTMAWPPGSIWPFPHEPAPLAFYRWKPQLKGNTCPQCNTGPLQHERTEDFITDAWRGQRWHYTCNHCDWTGSEEVAVGPYEEDERD